MISPLKARITAQAVINEYKASNGTKTVNEIIADFGYTDPNDITAIKAAIIAKDSTIPVD